MKIEKETNLATTTPFTPRVWEWRPFEWMKGLTRPMGWFYEPLMPFSGMREFGEFEFAPFPVELRETDEGFVVYATLPGFTEKEIEVRAEPRGVYVIAKHEEVKEEKKGKPVYSEQTYKQVARWVEMPAEIDPGKVTAVLHKGVLELTSQKAQAAKKIPVAVKAAYGLDRKGVAGRATPFLSFFARVGQTVDRCRFEHAANLSAPPALSRF